MELGHIKEFVVVAAMLRFRPAAIELGVSPSALSHHINALEAELGVRLLERDSHTVTLTPAGQAFLDETHAVTDQLEYAAELAKRPSTPEPVPRGKLA
jgi:DNA-binding transcriptional LysR family regulator